ncbi:uncharacterized protein LOC144766744 [Lissotriton helveticus]
MLTIAFIVIFCGLIAHMAQTYPSNQYDMQICPEIFSTYIGKQCPRDLVLPLPEEIETSTSGGLFSGTVYYTVNQLRPKGLVHVESSIMTAPGKKILLDVFAKQRVGGIFCNSLDTHSLTKVELFVRVHISSFLEIDMGGQQCGKFRNKGAIIVNVDVQIYDGDVLDDPELQSVLLELCVELESYIKEHSATVVKQLLKASVKALDELLCSITTPGPTQGGCTHNINDVNTDGLNIKLTIKSTQVIPGGMEVSASDIPKPIPLPAAGMDTGYLWVLHQAQINDMLQTLGTTNLELTDNLDAFSAALQQAGVHVPMITRVLLVPKGPPQVTIAGGRITGKLSGNLVLYAGAEKIVTANGVLTIDGTLEYNAPCVTINTDFLGMGNVRVLEQAPGLNCEGINGMDKEFTAIIAGQAFIEACAACSPAASLPPTCSTECRLMEGYAIIEHKRFS